MSLSDAPSQLGTYDPTEWSAPCTPDTQALPVDSTASQPDLVCQSFQGALVQVTTSGGASKPKARPHGRGLASSVHHVPPAFSAGTSAVATPLPGSGRRGSGGNGEGGNNGGNGSDGGNHEGGSEKREISFLETPTYILNVAQQLQETYGISVNTPPMVDPAHQQREFRELVLRGAFLKTLQELHSPDGPLKAVFEEPDVARKVRRYYQTLAEKNGCFTGDGILVQNFLGLMGIESASELLDLKVVEMACAHAPMAEMLKRLATQQSSDFLSRPSTANITLVDFATNFVALAQTQGFNAHEADICSTVEEFLQQTGIQPHSINLTSLFNVLDRTVQLQPTLDILHAISKKDATGRVLFGLQIPIDPSLNPVPGITDSFDCFGADDVRRTWMDPDPQKALFTITSFLQDQGFRIDSFAMQPYQTLSPYCPIADSQGEFVSQYSHLATYNFFDLKLNQKRDRIFSGTLLPEDFTDGKVVMPEIAPMVLIATTCVPPLRKKRKTP